MRESLQILKSISSEVECQEKTLTVFSSSVESLNQLPDVLLKLPHSVGRDEHVETGVGVGLGDLQKPSPRILLQVHVVLFVIFVHHLSLQLPLPQIVGINVAETAVELNELGEVLVELAGSGESHHYLVLRQRR